MMTKICFEIRIILEKGYVGRNNFEKIILKKIILENINSEKIILENIEEA